MKLIRVSSLLVVVALSAGPVFAQGTPPPAAAADAPQRGGGGPRGQRGGGTGNLAGNPAAALNTVQDMMDGAVLLRAQKVLQLSNDQYQSFIPKMVDLQHMRREHQRNRTRLVMALRQATRQGAAVDEATIAADIKALDDLESRMMTDERSALAAVDAVLTTYQRARFRIFEEDIEREKVALLAKVMAEPGRGPVPEPAGKKAGGLR